MGIDVRMMERDCLDWQEEDASLRSETALRRLKDALGAEARQDEPWEGEPWEHRVAAVYQVGPAPLLECLGHADPVVRQLAGYLLTYVDDDITAELLARLTLEEDAASRMGLLINLAGRDEDRALTFTGPEHSATDRLGAAFGLVLSHRRTEDGPELPDQVLDALLLCVRPAGKVLIGLLWVDQLRIWPLWAISPGLTPVDLQRWLKRLLDLPWVTDPSMNAEPGSPVLLATQLYQTHPELAIELLPRITELAATVELGRGVVGVPSLLPWFATRPGPDGPIRWDRDDPRLVALLHQVRNLYHRSPTVELRQILVVAQDPLAVPALLELVDRPLGKDSSALLRSATAHAAELTPPLAARLRQETDFGQLDLLVRALPDKNAVIAELIDRLLGVQRFNESRPTRDTYAVKVIVTLCEALGEFGGASPEVPAALLQVCAGNDLEVRLWAVRALMVLGRPADELVPILVSLITDHPSRSTKATPNQPATDTLGVGIDVQACRWLVTLGPAARAAEPVLRALLAEVDPDRSTRTMAARTWFGVMGDAETAIRALIEVTEPDYFRTSAEGEIRSISRVAPVLPTLEALAAEGNVRAGLLAASYRSA